VLCNFSVVESAIVPYGRKAVQCIEASQEDEFEAGIWWCDRDSRRPGKSSDLAALLSSLALSQSNEILRPLGPGTLCSAGS
jgi:hypothetical protein